MADGEINRNGATIRIDDDGGVQVEPAEGQEVEYTGPDRGTDAIRDSVNTEEQIINSNQVFVQADQPADLDDAVWLNTDPLPFSSIRVELTTDQSIPGGPSSQNIEFDNVERDVNNEYDLNDHGFQPIEAGEYQINGQIKYSGGDPDDRLTTFIFVDGDVKGRHLIRRPEIGANTPKDGTIVLPPISVNVAGGETVEFNFRNRDSDCDLVGDPQFSYLTISRVD